jgi:bifunctional DNA-binding transcriptional regulator/antitoxin component of YhaV-PrlF toxin-antitoxin module
VKAEAVLVKVSRLYKSSGGCAVHIPKKALEVAGLKRGDMVLIYVTSDGSILLKPLRI